MNVIIRREGMRWNAEDWSCAYDSILTPLFHVVRTCSDDLAGSIATSSDFIASFVFNIRNTVGIADGLQLHPILESLRDSLRDSISAFNPSRYPRHGAACIPADDLWCTLFPSAMLQGSLVLRCGVCSQVRLKREGRWYGWEAVPSRRDVLRLLALDTPISTSSISFEEWLHCLFLNAVGQRALREWNELCTVCHSRSSTLLEPCISSAPPLVVFNVCHWTLSSNPPQFFTIASELGPEVQYGLAVLVYHGLDHYTSRWVDQLGQIWQYDGVQNRGNMVLEFLAFPCCPEAALGSLGERQLNLLMYILVS